LSALLLFGGTRAAHAAGLFVSPIGGTPYKDWTIVNYVDRSPGGGVTDYLGGNYSYDGHNGIDFTLPNFAAMDRGVPVYAAADGIVVASHDGEFDRCTAESPCPDRPNYVVVDHGNGVTASYLHMRKGSVAVNVGDVVNAGEQIGLVGSSGLSTDAHLHFEVRQNGAVVDTYADPDTWWQPQARFSYAGNTPGVLDFGMTGHVPSIVELRERPSDLTSLVAGPGRQAFMWTNLHGIKEGDALDFYFTRPNGTLFNRLNWTAPQIRYGWWIAGINLPSVPQLGEWGAEFRLNGVSMARGTFAVIAAAAVPEPGVGAILAGACLPLTLLGAVRRRRVRGSAVVP
jgi:murein DD-endopeptidase MepM/ murein hydrolase activator NlpD